MIQKDNIRLELAKFGQEHLLNFFDELSNEEKEHLLQDIANVDLAEVTGAFARSNPKNESVAAAETIDDLLEPLHPDIHQSYARTSPKELQQYRSIGLKKISEGKVAALLLAGGQGTRLGSPNPKGMYDVGLPSHKTLFQIQAERILRLQELASKEFNKDASAVNIVWYIMTSGATIEPTVEFFKEHEYFGLNKSNIVFFEQNTMPCFNFEGQIILDKPYALARAPDGNGGLYKALRGQGILEDMSKRGIEHIHAYCVDNILVKVADPVFIGYCIRKDAECAAKVVEKVYPNEALGIICKVKGKFKVVEYSEVSHQTAQKRNTDGRLLFNAGNICNHYFTLNFLVNVIKEEQLMHHVAKKKIPFVDNNGLRVSPEKPNGIKLEKFVFDVFEFAKKFVVWEVLREDEFSPLKNSDSANKDNPTTARLSLFNLNQRYVLNAGGKFVDENGSPMSLIPSPALADGSNSNCDTNNNHVENQVICEISPLTSYDGENLEQLVKGKTFQSPLLL